MNRSMIAVIGIILMIASVAFAQQRRTRGRPTPKPTPAAIKEPPKPPPDPVSGDWNAVYQYQDLRIPFKMSLKRSGGIVSGEVIHDYGPRRITEGSWSDGQLNIVVENPDRPDRPRRMTATLSGTRFVGSFGPGSDTTWEGERFIDQVTRLTANQPAETAAKLRLEFEKLLSLKISLQMEGAYNLGEMREKAAAAVPFLIEILRQSGGVKEIDSDALKFLDRDGGAIVSGSKIMTVYPVQNVAAAALAKIGESAIEPIRNTVLKDDYPREVSFAFGVDALARMQIPSATKLLHDLTRTDNFQVRREIMTSLSRNKDPATVELLIEALTDKVSVIREAAARSLKKITGQDFREDSVKWKEWWANNKPKN